MREQKPIGRVGSNCLMNCGDANKNGNVELTFKGGCRKKVSLRESYRCSGCGGWFHKDCMVNHFKLEKDHDWGRKQKRDRLEKLIGKV